MEDNNQGKQEKEKPATASLGATAGKSDSKAETTEETNHSQQPADSGQQNNNAGPDNIGTSTPVNPDMNH